MIVAEVVCGFLTSDFKPIPSFQPSSPRKTCTCCFCKTRPQTHVPCVSFSYTASAQNPHLIFPGILAYQNSTKSSFLFVLCLALMNHSLNRWTSNSCLVLLSSNHHKNSLFLSAPKLLLQSLIQGPRFPNPYLTDCSLHTPSKDPNVSPFPLSGPPGLGFFLSTCWIPITKCNRKKSLKCVSSVCSYSQWYC